MQPRILKMLFATLMSILLLILFEVMTSAMLPAFGWDNYRLSFNVVIILYFALKMDTPLMPWFVLALQFIHSAFSIEGWALGTLTGILIATMVSYLKEMIQLNTYLMTIITVQIFQIIWHVLSSFIIALKMGSFDQFALMISATLPGTVLLSLLSPFIFTVLERIWRGVNHSFEGSRSEL